MKTFIDAGVNFVKDVFFMLGVVTNRNYMEIDETVSQTNRLVYVGS